MVNAENLRLVVAPDHGLSTGREINIRTILGKIPGLVLVDVMTASVANLKNIRAKTPNVLLLMSDLKTEEEINEFRGLVRRFQKQVPNSCFIVCAPDPEPELLNHSFQSGVAAWIDERVALEHLGLAVQSIASGQGYANQYVKMRPR